MSRVIGHSKSFLGVRVVLYVYKQPLINCQKPLISKIKFYQKEFKRFLLTEILVERREKISLESTFHLVFTLNISWDNNLCLYTLIKLTM